MAGFSTITSDESIVYADNASFDGTIRGGKMTTNGQLWIGSTISPHVQLGSITSPNNTLSIGYSSGNITMDLTGGLEGVQKFVPNSGTTPVVADGSGQVTLVGAGSLTTVGSSNTLTAQLTGLTNHNVLIGAGTATITKVAPSATSGVPLISQGASSDPAFGTAVVAGGGTGQVTLTNHGVLIGAGTTAITQLAAGSAGQVLQSGGASADPAYSTATFPSTASSTGTILRANGTNWVATTATYPTTTTTNQILYSSATSVISGLATANSAILNTDGSGVPSLATSPSCSGTLTAGTGLTATTGNITATAGDVIITSGKMTLPTTTSTVGLITIGGVVFMHAKGTNSTFLGNNAGSLSNTGSGNVGVGFEALLNVSSAQFNTCLGAFSGYNGTFSGTGNTFLGYGTGSVNSSGNYNVGCGYTSLTNVTTGQYNTCIGQNAGQQYTSSESSNVLVGNSGTTGESNVMRLGTAGSGNGQVSSCFVAGVTGVTVTGTAVLCSATGQFGTIASSERYKENIEDMPESISILNLRPIQFNYKSDEEKRIQYGLLAEEVHRDFPYLCHYNEDKQPESVKYHEICVFLLAEIQKMDKKIRILESKCA